MKKLICILLALWCCFLCGCGNRNQEDTAPEMEETIAEFDYRNFDWEQFLADEVFDTSTAVGAAIREAVTIQVDQVSDAELTVSIQGPNICQEMDEWIALVSEADFTEDAMQQQILSALNTVDKQVHSFTLSYSVVQNMPEILYPSDYLDTVSCGLLTFYNGLYERIIAEMGGTGNE